MSCLKSRNNVVADGVSGSSARCGAAIHFWPNGAGPEFSETFQEALLSEFKDTLKNVSRQSHECCGPCSVLPRGTIAFV